MSKMKHVFSKMFPAWNILLFIKINNTNEIHKRTLWKMSENVIKQLSFYF